jgi:hypothetical protein
MHTQEQLAEQFELYFPHVGALVMAEELQGEVVFHAHARPQWLIRPPFDCKSGPKPIKLTS